MPQEGPNRLRVLDGGQTAGYPTGFDNDSRDMGGDAPEGGDSSALNVKPGEPIDPDSLTPAPAMTAEQLHAADQLAELLRKTN